MTPTESSRRRDLLAWACALLGAAAGCGGGERVADGDAGEADADTDADGDGDSDGDADTDTGTEPDGVSGATPLVESARLTEAHAGWQTADCGPCHAAAHGAAGYSPPDCVTCHGVNGSPVRPAGHADTGCADAACHADPHPGAGFEPPGDCRSCHAFSPPPDAACSTESSWDVVVIGAGGGGLSTAAYLAQQGLSVLVLEKHYKAGGYMVNFTRGDYRFEASLHGFDGLDPTVFDSFYGDRTGVNVDVLERLGIYDKVTPVRCDPMYKAIYPLEEHRISIPASTDDYMALLKTLFPAEAAGLDSLYGELKKIDEVMRIIFRYQNQGKDPTSGTDSIAFIAEMTSKGLLSTAQQVQGYMNDGTSLSAFLAGYVTDPQLIAIFTQLAGFLGGSPDNIPAIFFVVMWNNYHFGGYYYFVGGSQSLSDALVEVIGENGGEVRYNSLVTKIDVAGGLATGVRTADGSCFGARYVVSNANARATLVDMLGAENLPTDPASPFTAAKLEAGNEESYVVGMSMFQVYLGVDTDYAPLFEGTHEVMLSESYDQAENFASYAASEVDEASYAILDYSVVDPTMAPEGKNSLSLGTILMFDWEDRWHWDESHEAYQAFKEETAWRLIQRAEADFLPGLTEHIEVIEVGSPQTMRGFTLSLDGSIFGWDSRPSQLLTNRLPQQTHIDNLLLAGAWTSPGGGQSAVMISGLLAGISIMKKEAK